MIAPPTLIATMVLPVNGRTRPNSMPGSGGMASGGGASAEIWNSGMLIALPIRVQPSSSIAAWVDSPSLSKAIVKMPK